MPSTLSAPPGSRREFTAAFEPGSFRDREARVFVIGDGGIYRALRGRAWQDWQSVEQSRFYANARDKGAVINSRALQGKELPALFPPGWEGVLRHERVPFVSYPHEWSFGMLRDAALLQLALVASALEDDFTLKDGKADNVQWQGAHPIFIDVASFERYEPGMAWAGYRQFCQTMLFPLMLTAYRGIPFQPWLRGRLEGIDPEDCWRMMSLRDVARRGVLAHVFLHARLQQSSKMARSSTRRGLAQAGFNKRLIQANINGLTKIVRRMQWRGDRSAWLTYDDHNSYSPVDRERKDDFLKRVLGARHRGMVWDLGCNTGRFARMAAQHADYVVAMDADHAVIERLYQSLARDPNLPEHRKILPLMNNLADSTGGQGFRGLERKPLLERGRPELTLCLALIHHLAISAGIPLPELVEWLSGLTDELVIEFVDPRDPMVEQLVLNRRDACFDYTREAFERLLAQSFSVAAREELPSGTRVLYHALSRRAAR
jgi:SAM-dependent methyltransferase